MQFYIEDNSKLTQVLASVDNPSSLLCASVPQPVSTVVIAIIE